MDNTPIKLLTESNIGNALKNLRADFAVSAFAADPDSSERESFAARADACSLLLIYRIQLMRALNEELLRERG